MDGLTDTKQLLNLLCIVYLAKLIVLNRLNLLSGTAGIQGIMFSDVIQTEEQMHYALFPRLLAVAERAWHEDSWENSTDNDRREQEQQLAWEKFAAKLGYLELPRLDGQHFNYRVPPPGAMYVTLGNSKF